jgi:glycerol-3-phosphate dehydrogenase
MAEDVLEHCFDAGLLPSRAGGMTESHVLVGAGGHGPRPALYQAPGLHLYGDEASVVTALPGADRELGLGLTEAMVRFAAQSEHAHTVEDVLARRWRALFLDAAEAERMAPAVAEILREVQGGDPALEAFVALARRYRLVESAIGS